MSNEARMGEALTKIKLLCADELLTDHSSRRVLLKRIRKMALDGFGDAAATSGDRAFAHEDNSGHRQRRIEELRTQ